MIASALAWVNAVLALLLVVFAARYVRQPNATARWIKFVYAMVGIYWFGLYTWVALVPVGIVDPVWFGQVFVRPAFTVTLAVMAGGAIYRWRSYD